MKNLDVYEECGSQYDKIFGTTDIAELLAIQQSDPEKIAKFVKNNIIREMQGVARYSTAFTEELNALPPKERPYALIGIETALKAINKVIKEQDPIIYEKVRSLRDISNKCLVAIGGHKDE